MVKYEYEHTPEHPKWRYLISHTHTYIKRTGTTGNLQLTSNVTKQDNMKRHREDVALRLYMQALTNTMVNAHKDGL